MSHQIMHGIEAGILSWFVLGFALNPVWRRLERRRRERLDRWDRKR